jgi:hypothetical protein
MPYFAAMMLYSETASTAKLFLYLGGDGVVGDDEDYNDVNDDMCVCEERLGEVGCHTQKRFDSGK